MMCKFKQMFLWFWGILSVLVLAPLAFAYPAETKVMEEILVTGQEEKKDKALPDVEGTKIYSGKKTSVIDLEAAPTNINNNYRQALQKTPGLLLSEETTPLFSVGYRGLDPHRAQFS